MPTIHALTKDFEAVIKGSVLRAVADEAIVRELLDFAAQGNHEVAALLSNLYLGNVYQIEDREVTFLEDHKEAFKWAQVAVATGESSAHALWQLGMFYAEGTGCEKNVAAGLSLMHHALYIRMRYGLSADPLVAEEIGGIRTWADDIRALEQKENLILPYSEVLGQNKQAAMRVTDAELANRRARRAPGQEPG